MSVKQDRFTFFGVLAAVVIVVLGYLQLGQLYPVAGRADSEAADRQDAEHETETTGETMREGDAQP